MISNNFSFSFATKYHPSHSFKPKTLNGKFHLPFIPVKEGDIRKKETPEIGSNYFALNDQVGKIERFLDTHKISFPHLIRLKIIQTLEYTDFKNKMGELGAILFYLDRDGQLPEHTSLLTYRAEEIREEIEYCLSMHSKYCDNPLIPSGRTFCLKEAFAHMTLTSEQVYNPGGLIAVQLFLSDPFYQIAPYLKPEQREHISTVSSHILNNSAFVTLFRKKIGVHSAMQDVIRLDLKLAPTHKIESVHALYAACIALFTPVRQLGEPNCYAISVLLYASVNHTYKTFETLLNLYERGHCIFKGAETIPLWPIIEKRLTAYSDLSCKLSEDKALKLTPFTQLAKALSLFNNTSELESVPIKKVLASWLTANSASEHFRYAKMFYSSYKRPCSIQLQIAYIEFININFSSHFIGQCNFSVFKLELIKKCINSVEKAADLTFPPLLHKILTNKLCKMIWLESCNDSEAHAEENSIISSSLLISNFRGDAKALASVLEESLRVFALYNNQYNSVSTLDSLQWVMNITIRLATQEFNREGDKKFNYEPWISAVYTKTFRLAISNFVASQINKSGIQGKYLESANLFACIQQGGCTQTALNQVYDITASEKFLARCNTPLMLLKSLILQLKDLDVSFFKIAPKFLVVSSEHAWTQSAIFWKDIAESKQDFDTLMRTLVFEPAKKILSSSISNKVKKRIFTRCVNEGLKEDVALFQQTVPQKQMSYSRFKSLFLGTVRKSFVNKAREIIEDEFSKIRLSEVVLSKILKNLNIEMPISSFAKLNKSLGGIIAQPYQLAYRLHTFLIQEKIDIIDPYTIENALCSVMNLPRTFLLGDLNYVDIDKEDHSHLLLAIAFSWCRGEPAYYQRSPQRQILENNKEYKYLQLFYPTILDK